MVTAEEPSEGAGEAPPRMSMDRDGEVGGPSGAAQGGDAAPAGMPASPDPVPPFDPSGKKVLVIDDSPVNCRIVGVALERRGYTVITAFHGSEGIRLAIEEHPDCIILDLMMPDLNGFDVCQVLRGKEGLDGVPIIIYTSRNTKEDVILALKAGADDYIVKPAPAPVICEKVQRVLSSPARHRRTASEGSAARAADGPAETAGEDARAEGSPACAEDLLRQKTLFFEPPSVLQELMALSEDSPALRERLAGILSSDPEISSAVLRLAESAKHGKGRPNRGLAGAIARLGVPSTRCRILALCVRRLLARLPEGSPLDGRSYWHHALAAGITAKILARGAGASEESAFLGGILHDVGKLMFAVRLPASFGQAIEVSCREGIPLHEAERRILGSDHATVGGRLSSVWNLPEPIQEAIAEHHQPRPPGTERCAVHRTVVSAANVIAKAFRMGSAGDPRIQEIPPRDSARFGEALRHRQGLRRAILEEMVELEQLMGEDAGACTRKGAGDAATGTLVDIWASDPIRFLVCETFLEASGIRTHRLDELSSAKDRRPLVCRLGPTLDPERAGLLKEQVSRAAAPVVLLLAPESSLRESCLLEGLPRGAAVLREPYEGDALVRLLTACGSRASCL